MKTRATLAIEVIQRIVKVQKCSLDDAARKLASHSPPFVSALMEDLGAWPSSEPELAAIQRVYMRS